MKLGTNYPRGPFEWAEEIGASSRPETLDALRLARGDAYLASPLLGRGAPDRPVSN
jgi:3-hydroxybutyryl-CoA dehydrogenase